MRGAKWVIWVALFLCGCPRRGAAAAPASPGATCSPGDRARVKVRADSLWTEGVVVSVGGDSLVLRTEDRWLRRGYQSVLQRGGRVALAVRDLVSAEAEARRPGNPVLRASVGFLGGILALGAACNLGLVPDNNAESQFSFALFTTTGVAPAVWTPARCWRDILPELRARAARSRLPAACGGGRLRVLDGPRGAMDGGHPESTDPLPPDA